MSQVGHVDLRVGEDTYADTGAHLNVFRHAKRGDAGEPDRADHRGRDEALIEKIVQELDDHPDHAGKQPLQAGWRLGRAEKLSFQRVVFEAKR